MQGVMYRIQGNRVRIRMPPPPGPLHTISAAANSAGRWAGSTVQPDHQEISSVLAVLQTCRASVAESKASPAVRNLPLPVIRPLT